MPAPEYSSAYWDNYYEGCYEKTFHLGFPLKRILEREWRGVYGETLPQSFADIGCGLGQTLLAARSLMPEALVYGVECQKIPKARQASQNIYFGDFMKIHPQLPAVDLLYVSCSMYIPWEEQASFLAATISLAKKAVVYANLYLEDGKSIPSDTLRQSLYRTRSSFRDVLTSFGFIFKGSMGVDFFIPK